MDVGRKVIHLLVRHLLAELLQVVALAPQVSKGFRVEQKLLPLPIMKQVPNKELT